MIKPEYKTLDYLKAHLNQWWEDQEGQKHYVVGIGENGWVVHQYFDKDGNRQTATCSLGMFFVDNIRPESDPAPVKRKVECDGVYLVFNKNGRLHDWFGLEGNAKRMAKDIEGCVQHIPAKTIEVEQ